MRQKYFLDEYIHVVFLHIFIIIRLYKQITISIKGFHWQLFNFLHSGTIS
jgi:hypothetical protein